MEDLSFLQIVVLAFISFAVVYISFVIIYIVARLISHAYFRAKEEFIRKTKEKENLHEG